LAAIDSGSHANGRNTAEDEFEDVFGEFTSSAPPAQSASAMDRTKSREKASVSLLDLDFEDGPDVPLPSTLTAKAIPKKLAPQAQSKRTSGFFAVNPAVLNASSPVRASSGSSRTCESYAVYKAKHEQLTPYVRVLRSCSTATSSALTSTISASHALSLLFPPTQNGPTPLDAQAFVLVDLLRFLSTAIEPTRDWGWLRRVLGGVCDRFEAVCLSAFDRAESVRPSPTASLHSAISTNTTTAALRLVSEASWNVYRTTRETSPRDKRYRAHAKETPVAGNVQQSIVTIVQDLIDDQVEWELGRAWIEKREVFYEGAKWDPSKNVVYVKHLSVLLLGTNAHDICSKIANSQTAQTHRLDFTPMNDFISHVLAAIDRDGSEIAAVFPGLAGLTVVYKFAERLANDVVSASPFVLPRLPNKL
jgi:recyclin-1